MKCQNKTILDEHQIWCAKLKMIDNLGYQLQLMMAMVNIGGIYSMGGSLKLSMKENFKANMYVRRSFCKQIWIRKAGLFIPKL